MKVLSVKQPWAWLLIRPDVTDPEHRKFLYRANLIKNVENRERFTHFTGECVITASKEPIPKREFQTVREMVGQRNGILIPEQLPHGGTIGVVKFLPCVEKMESDWFLGPYGYPVEESRPLPFVPMLGQLGFYDLKPEIYEQLRVKTIQQSISSKDAHFTCYYYFDCNGRRKDGVTVIRGATREIAIQVFQRENRQVTIDNVTP